MVLVRVRFPDAVEQNNIVLFQDQKAMRMRVELRGIYEQPWRFEEVDLNDLLK
jgi:hypothetical protein